MWVLHTAPHVKSCMHPHTRTVSQYFLTINEGRTAGSYSSLTRFFSFTHEILKHSWDTAHVGLHLENEMCVLQIRWTNLPHVPAQFDSEWLWSMDWLNCASNSTADHFQAIIPVLTFKAIDRQSCHSLLALLHLPLLLLTHQWINWCCSEFWEQNVCKSEALRDNRGSGS